MSWPHRRPFNESVDEYRQYLAVSIHISTADSTLLPSDASYRKKQYGTYFFRAGEHIVKWCTLMYETLLWEFIRTGSYEISFGTFANAPERLFNLTNVEETFWQELR